MFLTKEQVDLLTLEQAKRALKLLTKTYDMELPISKFTKEDHRTLDLVCDTYNYLTDRIKYIETCARLDAARPTIEKRLQAQINNETSTDTDPDQ
jgi:gamma-glutamylcysteine synthetase